jgi:hypothetical protein
MRFRRNIAAVERHQVRTGRDLICGYQVSHSREVRAMSNPDLEGRVERLERELTRLQTHIGDKPAEPWWERIAGSFSNDSAYAEARRLAIEYRASQTADQEASQNAGS